MNVHSTFYQGLWAFLSIILSVEKDKAFHQIKFDMYWMCISSKQVFPGKYGWIREIVHGWLQPDWSLKGYTTFSHE